MYKTVACYRCGAEFQVQTYYGDSHTYCPTCRRTQRDALREEKRDVVWAVRCKFPCCVCGESDPDVLVFHHIDPRTKHRNEWSVTYTRGAGGRRGVSELVGNNMSLRKLVEELNKCAVLCHNCHHRVHIGAVSEEALIALDLPLPEKRNRYNTDTYRKELDAALRVLEEEL